MSRSDAAARYVLNRSQRRQRLYSRLWLAVASLSLGTVAYMMYSLWVAPSPADRLLEAMQTTNPQVASVAALQRDFAKFRLDADTVQKALKQAKPESVQAAELEKLRLQNGQLELRLGRLEGALTVNAEKALSLPMMRKDLDGLNARLAEHRSMAILEVDRLYSVLLWALGIMVTLLIALVGGAFALKQGWFDRRPERPAE